MRRDPTTHGGVRGATKPPAAFPDAARTTTAVKLRLRPHELDALREYAAAYHRCELCAGTGTRGDHPCPRCHGTRGDLSRAAGDSAVLAATYREALGRP